MSEFQQDSNINDYDQLKESDSDIPDRQDAHYRGSETEENQVSSPPTPKNIVQKQLQIRNSQTISSSNHHINKIINKKGSDELPQSKGFIGQDEDDAMEHLYRSKDNLASIIQKNISPIKTGYSQNNPHRQEEDEVEWPKGDYAQSIDNYSQEQKSIATDTQSQMVPQNEFQTNADAPSQSHIRSQLSSANQERLKFLKEKFGPYKTESELFTYEELSENADFLIIRFKDALYRGQIKDKDQRQGLGIMVYEKTGRIYEGGWVNDRRHGKGYERYSNGNVYQGEFERGKANGEGAYLWKSGEYYEGGWLNGQKHGKGEWKNQTGDRYTGEWKDNKANGIGEHVWGSGDRYQGDWVNFLKHGYGTDFFANGDKYVGKYRYGKPWGFGKYYWATGAVYEGEFVEGKKCGKGKWVKRPSRKSQMSPDSDVSSQNHNEGTISYEGEYANDVKEGFGKYRWATGNSYQGNYKNDKRHFYGEMFWTDGSVYKGEWLDGVQNGFGNMLMANGEQKEGLFENGVFKCEGNSKEVQAILANRSQKKKQQELEPVSKKGLKASSGRRLKKAADQGSREQQQLLSNNAGQDYSRKQNYQKFNGREGLSKNLGKLVEEDESEHFYEVKNKRKLRVFDNVNSERMMNKNESAPVLRIQQHSPIDIQERQMRNKKINPPQTTIMIGGRVSAPFTEIPERIMRRHQLSQISELSMENQYTSKRGSTNTFLPEIREKVQRHNIHSEDTRPGLRRESLISLEGEAQIRIQNQRTNYPSSSTRRVSSHAGLPNKHWIPSGPIQRNDGIQIIRGKSTTKGV